MHVCIYTQIQTPTHNPGSHIDTNKSIAIHWKIYLQHIQFCEHIKKSTERQTGCCCSDGTPPSFILPASLLLQESHEGLQKKSKLKSKLLYLHHCREMICHTLRGCSFLFVCVRFGMFCLHVNVWVPLSVLSHTCMRILFHMFNVSATGCGLCSRRPFPCVWAASFLCKT